MKRRSLDQVILIVIIATLLPIGAFTIVQSINNRNYLRALVGERLVSSALATAAVQRDPFLTAERLLASFSTNNTILKMDPGCSAALKKGLNIEASVINFTRVDENGNVRCSGVPLRAPVSQVDIPRWPSGKAQSGLSIHGPVYGTITGKQVFVLMRPIRSRDGSFDGAVAAAIDVSWLEQDLARHKLSSDAVIAITDARGRALVSSGRRGLPLIDLARSNAMVATLSARDGGQWLSASAPLFRNRLHIVYAEIQNPLVQSLELQLRTSIIVPFLAIVLTCLAVWLALQRYVVRWLQRLSLLANQFGQGSFVHDATQFTNAPSELAALGADLSNMADAINRRDHELSVSAARNLAMAREVNHRIKNNLQLVVSLLELQMARFADGPARYALTETRMRVSAIALIHRLMYETGESSEHGDVDLDRLMIDLCAQLRGGAMRPDVDLRFSGQLATVPVDFAVPLTMFTVEAVNQSYRRAFDDVANPYIAVEIKGSITTGQLIITDNSAGDVAESEDPMGKQLMEAYATQVDGSVTSNRDKNGTTVVTLEYRWTSG